VAGLLTYGYQALVARSLTEAQFGGFGAFWSTALIIGFGGFLPIELELARRLQQPGAARLPRGAAATTGGLVVASLAVVLLVAPVLGRTPLLPLLGICLISSVQFLTRGLLLGTNRLPLHGTVMLVDAALRVGLAALVAATVGDAGVSAFAWTLVVAIAVAHTPVLVWLSRRVERPARATAAVATTAQPPARVFRGAAGHLLIGTLCAQVLLNAAPVVVSAVAGAGEAGTAGRFIACFTLVRLPLFVAVPLQSAIVPALTRVLAAPDTGRLRTLVLRLAAGIAGITAVAFAVGLLAGPFLVRLLFGARYALSAPAIALLAVGSGLYLGLLVLSQTLVADARHRQVALVWGVGLLVAAVVVAVVPGLVLRASLSFVAGSGAALLIAFVVLLRPSARAEEAAARAEE
jgi:O-antigen/teichoic acid export membrane protein